MIRQLSMEQLALLRRNWTVFCCASAKTPLSSGSGCTGSGMDWFVLEVVCEVLMHLVVGQSVAQVLLCPLCLLHVQAWVNHITRSVCTLH